VIDLLEFAACILIELSISGEDVQFFE